MPRDWEGISDNGKTAGGHSVAFPDVFLTLLFPSRRLAHFVTFQQPTPTMF